MSNLMKSFDRTHRLFLKMSIDPDAMLKVNIDNVAGKTVRKKEIK